MKKPMMNALNLKRLMTIGLALLPSSTVFADGFCIYKQGLFGTERYAIAASKENCLCSAVADIGTVEKQDRKYVVKYLECPEVTGQCKLAVKERSSYRVLNQEAQELAAEGKCGSALEFASSKKE